MDSCIPGRRARARRSLGTCGLVLVLFATGLARPQPIHACDICAVYTATEQREDKVGPRIGLATQYSHFGTIQQGGDEVPNPEGEYIDSVVSQFVLGYQLTPRIGLQLNVPIISRQYRRIEDGGRVRGNVSGFGDLSLLADVLAYSMVTETSVFRFSLLGGLKLPSGNPSFLAEELDEDHHHGEAIVAHHSTGGGEPTHGADHTSVPSAVHGHDLTLGSGSVDGIVGGSIFYSWNRAFISGAMQYAVRTEGAFDYQFANDLTWLGGPGYYVLLSHDSSVALQAVVSGETKGNDTVNGEKTNDTGVTNLFVGPRIQFTWGTSLYAEGTFELPAVQNNTSRQIVADYRLRGAAVWRF